MPCLNCSTPIIVKTHLHDCNELFELEVVLWRDRYGLLVYFFCLFVDLSLAVRKYNRFEIRKQMDYFQSKRSNRGRYIFDASEEEFSYSEPNEVKVTKNVHQHFAALYVARERFVKFVQSLGPNRCTQIRQDILSHCQQNSKKQHIYQTFISDQMILKIINLRIDKMIKNKRIKKNWSEEDVQILIWVISKYADKNHFEDIEKEIDNQDWEMIASLIPGVIGQSCMFKWLSLKKINLATNNWSQQQSQLLSKLVGEKDLQAKGRDTKDWKLISQKLYFLNNRTDKIFRNAKQCRQHWNCYLNPNLKKGPWRPSQDIQLLKCIKQNKGSKKWSQIVKYFDGRTENALKNRYTLIIEKQKKHNKHKSELQIIEQYLVRCYVDQFTTDIKQSSSEQENSSSSQRSFQVKVKHQLIVPGHQDQGKNQQQLNKTLIEPSITPMTPIRVQKFNGFHEFVTKSMDKFDINSIQLGMLNNGIFQKSQTQKQKGISLFPKQFSIKRYNSSYN